MWGSALEVTFRGGSQKDIEENLDGRWNWDPSGLVGEKSLRG